MTSIFTNPANPVLLISPLLGRATRHPLPFLIYAGMAGLQLKQWSWWFWHKRQVYTNPNNFLPIVAGHLIDLFTDNRALKFAAKLILIIERIEECQAIIQKLSLQYAHLQEVVLSFRRNIYVCHRKSLPFKQEHSTRQKFKDFRNHILDYLSRLWAVVRRIFILFSQLALTLYDTYECIYSKHEAVQELIVNGMSLAQSFEKNKVQYLAKLERHRETLKYLFSTLQIEEINVDQLIEQAKKAIRITAAVMKPINQTTKLIQKVSRKIDHVVKEVGKNMKKATFKKKKPISSTRLSINYQTLKPLTESPRYQRKKNITDSP